MKHPMQQVYVDEDNKVHKDLESCPRGLVQQKWGRRTILGNWKIRVVDEEMGPIQTFWKDSDARETWRETHKLFRLLFSFP